MEISKIPITIPKNYCHIKIFAKTIWFLFYQRNINVQFKKLQMLLEKILAVKLLSQMGL